MTPEELTLRKFRHVNNHLTPLAVLIVVPGLLVGNFESRIVLISLILMGYAIFINYLSVHLLRQHPKFMSSFRVGSNYTVNIFLLWLIYPDWPLVWVLLVLMSLGPAVYQSRRDSVLAAAAFATLLLAVHWSFGDSSLYGWTVVAVQVGFILTVNLFVNGLLQLTEAEVQHD